MQLDLLTWTRPAAAAPVDVEILPSIGALVPWDGVTPRDWQASALPACLASVDAGKFGLVSAVMGSGKSIFLAEIVRLRPAPDGSVVVVTTPTVRLVDQLAATLSTRIGAESVGRYYTHAKEIRPIIVCCQPSALALAAELTARGVTVGLWIADEAHKTQGATMLAAAQALSPAAAIGCTATPFRSLPHEDLSLWPALLHEYSAKDAFGDGVVVKPELIMWDGAELPIDDVCVTLIHRLLARFPGVHLPGLVNADSIADAEKFAAVLTRAGITSGVIHSKIDRAAQAVVIDRLRVGELAALVHVNMLSEGVDLPWLRWLCMRRVVGSSVRFCQEVGRVLRSAPGLLPPKTCAFLLDPNDLFDSFGLTYEAMLAGSAKAKADKSELDELAEEVLREPDEDLPEKIRQSRLVARLDSARRYVRHLFVSMLAAGVVEQKIKSTGWRKFEPSEKQLGALGWSMGKMIADTAVPLGHRKALAWVRENAASLQKGDVSDLMTIGIAVRDRLKAGQGWPALEVDPTPQDEPDPMDLASCHTGHVPPDTTGI